MADITNPLLPQGWSVDSDIIQFFIDFYKISDSPTAHDTYTGMFTGDATFILASSTSIGREGTCLPLLTLKTFKGIFTT